MREVKFRAWDKDEKKFWYFNLQEILERQMAYTGSFDRKILVGEKTQYTGLKDKNGTEIYEGDIIGFEDYTSTESGYWEQQCTGVVEWRDETVSFEVSNRLSAESYEVLDECLVIGNIYENKELME